MRSDTFTRIALAGAAGALALPAAQASAAHTPPPAVRTDAPALSPLLRAAKAPLVRRDVRVARRLASVKGTRLRHGYAQTLSAWPLGRLSRHHTTLLHALHHARAAKAAAASGAVSGTPAGAGGASTASAPLQAIAACESGGNPSTDTGNGFYGKYQFTMSTWQAVGGTGNPAQASEAEQDARAAQLYAQAGPGQWPVCGR